jgi:hypothetical protein
MITNIRRCEVQRLLVRIARKVRRMNRYNTLQIFLRHIGPLVPANRQCHIWTVQPARLPSAVGLDAFIYMLGSQHSQGEKQALKMSCIVLNVGRSSF